MKRAFRPILFWAVGCALLSGGVAVLTVLSDAWLHHVDALPDQIYGSASFGVLFGALTGLLIAYLRGSKDEQPTQRSFDLVTLALIVLLLGSTFYWMLLG